MKHRTITYLDVAIAVNDVSGGFSLHLNCPDLYIDKPDTIQEILSDRDVDIFLSRMENLSGTEHPDRDCEDAWLTSRGVIIGEALFGNLQPELHRIMEAAQQPLRGVRFNITSKGPRSNAIPWEVLCDPVSRRHLGHSSKFTIIRSPARSMSGAPSPIALGERVRVLAVSASPPKIGTIHADFELPKIKKILANLQAERRVDVVTEQRQSWSQVCELLENHSPHLLHVIAHGRSKGVIFEDNTIIPYSVLFDELSRQEHLRVVILNICDSCHLLELQGLFGTELEIPSLNGIWAVLLNRTTISSDASEKFTIHLYRTLARHHSLSVAVGQARHRLRGLDPHAAVQWSTPMLHQVCDVLPFPVSERLKSWLTATLPTMVEIQLYQRHAQQTLESVKQIKLVVIDSYPNNVQLLHIPDKRGHIHELYMIFSEAFYPISLISWQDTSLRILRELKVSMDIIYENVYQALYIDELDREHRECIEKMRSQYETVNSLANELYNHINSLIIEYEDMIPMN